MAATSTDWLLEEAGAGWTCELSESDKKASCHGVPYSSVEPELRTRCVMKQYCVLHGGGDGKDTCAGYLCDNHEVFLMWSLTEDTPTTMQDH